MHEAPTVIACSARLLGPAGSALRAPKRTEEFSPDL